MRKEPPLSKREYNVLRGLYNTQHNIIKHYITELSTGEPKSKNDPTYDLYSIAFALLQNVDYDLDDVIWDNYLDYDIARECAEKHLTYDEYLSLLSHEE